MTGRTAGLIAAVAVAAVLGVATLAGCGVPLDNAPHPIAQTTIAVTDTTPTTVGTGTQTVTAYFLTPDGALQGQEFTVDGEPTLSTALAYALAAPPSNSDDLRTQVPPGTELRNAEITDGTATIDLTNEINDVGGPNQKQAFAQIVFTALAFDGVDQVQFKIDGSPVDAPTDNGNRPVIRASDYDKPLNPR